VGECLGMWWRPDFETLLYPFLPPNIKQPKVHKFYWLVYASSDKGCPSFIALLSGVGVYKSLPCEVACQSEVHCTQEYEVACSPIVPSS